MEISNDQLQHILRILSAGPMTGRSIAENLKQTGDHILSAGEGSLYPILHTMEQRHFIHSQIQDTPSGLERRVYRLTAKGKRIAKKTKSSQSFHPHLPELMPDDGSTSIRIIRLRRWSMDASLGIYVSPDREIVSQELYDHLYDLVTGLILMGMTPDAAEQAAYEAMGSHKDIAASLGQIHRPFWTKALRTTRWIILLLSIVTLVCYSFHFLETHFFRNTIVDFDPDSPPAISGTHALLWEDTPSAADESGGYRVRAYHTALWETISLDGEERTLLNIQLKVSNPIPWAEIPDFGDWIWAEDSLGNIYLSGAQDTPGLEPALQVIQYHVSRFSYVQDIWIFQYVSQDAQWLELHYDRSGRDIVLRVSLPGGDRK